MAVVNIAAHEQALIAAEAVRQSAMASALALSSFAAVAAAVRVAEIAFYKSALHSSFVNNVNGVCYSIALAELGAPTPPS